MGLLPYERLGFLDPFIQVLFALVQLAFGVLEMAILFQLRLMLLLEEVVSFFQTPFRFAVLLARIRAQLRQHEASEDAVFAIGPYTFRPSSKLLLSPKGTKVRLTEKETAILRYLYRAGQKPVARDVLLQEVWGYNSGVTTHTLETHIYRLRQKVEKDAANPAILVTDAGGYKLVP